MTQQYGVVSEENSEISESGTSSVSNSSDGIRPPTIGSPWASSRVSLWVSIGHVGIHPGRDYAGEWISPLARASAGICAAPSLAECPPRVPGDDAAAADPARYLDAEDDRGIRVAGVLDLDVTQAHDQVIGRYHDAWLRHQLQVTAEAQVDIDVQ